MLKLPDQSKRSALTAFIRISLKYYSIYQKMDLDLNRTKQLLASNASNGNTNHGIHTYCWHVLLHHLHNVQFMLIYLSWQIYPYIILMSRSGTDPGISQGGMNLDWGPTSSKEARNSLWGPDYVKYNCFIKTYVHIKNMSASKKKC